MSSSLTRLGLTSLSPTLSPCLPLLSYPSLHPSPLFCDCVLCACVYILSLGLGQALSLSLWRYAVSVPILSVTVYVWLALSSLTRNNRLAV